MSVKIFYGPYESHGVIRHRKQRLHGVAERLDELGITTELVPTPFINVVTVFMLNKQIFRCDIRNLLFNMDLIDDPVAQRLVDAVVEAEVRFYSPDNVPKFAVVNDDNPTGDDPDIHYMYIIPADCTHDAEKLAAQGEMIKECAQNDLHNEMVRKASDGPGPDIIEEKANGVETTEENLDNEMVMEASDEPEMIDEENNSSPIEMDRSEIQQPSNEETFEVKPPADDTINEPEMIETEQTNDMKYTYEENTASPIEEDTFEVQDQITEETLVAPADDTIVPLPEDAQNDQNPEEINETHDT